METTEKLIERIIRAKVALEELRHKLSHTRYCVIDVDPEGFSPCDCGASERLAHIDKALKALTFD